MSRLSPELAQLDSEVHAFVEGLPAEPSSLTLEERFAYLVDVQRRLHEAGLAVVAWPEKWGGRGLGPEAAAVVSTALGRSGSPEVINFVALDVLAPALMKFGTAQQLDQWLPPMAPAAEVWCQLFSEPDAGSDLAALRTRATPQNDGTWVVHGRKVWATWGQFAQRGLLLARTGALADRHRSITAFVIDMHSPGVEVRPLRSMTGSAEFAEITLDGLALGPDDVVGEVSTGWAVAMAILEAERGTYPIRRASLISAALRRLRLDCNGRSLTTNQRRSLVDAIISVQLLQNRLDVVVRHLQTGQPIGPQAAVTKILLTRTEQVVRAAAVEVLGLDALVRTPDNGEILDEWLYSRAASIYGGSTQIQRNLIGERLLGLPPEPSFFAARPVGK